MPVVGQPKILEKLNRIPSILLLIGEKGSGRHLISSEISRQLNLDIEDISESINKEQLYDIYTAAEQKIYFLDFSKIDIKRQNSLLKFIEEPPQNSYILGICENKAQVIYTLLNRFSIWELEKYSKETLRQFTDNEDLISIFNTPGQLKEFESLSIDISKYKATCDALIERIQNANIANILTLPNKIAFSEKDKKTSSNISIDLFKIILLNTIEAKVRSSNDKRYINQYSVINRLISDLYVPNINKKILFEHFLLEFKYTR